MRSMAASIECRLLATMELCIIENFALGIGIIERFLFIFTGASTLDMNNYVTIKTSFS